MQHLVAPDEGPGHGEPVLASTHVRINSEHLPFIKGAFFHVRINSEHLPSIRVAFFAVEAVLNVRRFALLLAFRSLGLLLADWV